MPIVGPRPNVGVTSLRRRGDPSPVSYTHLDVYKRQAQYGIRPKKRYEQEASGALIRHLFKCVNSLETSWRLQRHGVATHQYDRRLRVQYFKSLSPTEDLAVASSSTGQEILILHRTSLRDSISLRAGSELMLDSSSSLLLYPGLRWYFQWQAVNALDSHLQSELQVSQLPK